MNKTHICELIGGQRPIQAVISVRTHQYIVQRRLLTDGDDHLRVRIAPLVARELRYVSRLHLFHWHLHAHWARPRFAHKKAVQKLHARPRRRAAVRTVIVPAERRLRVHYAAARVYALRREVGAVPAQLVEVIVVRVA